MVPAGSGLGQTRDVDAVSTATAPTKSESPSTSTMYLVAPGDVDHVSSGGCEGCERVVLSGGEAGWGTLTDGLPNEEIDQGESSLAALRARTRQYLSPDGRFAVGT